MVSEYFWIIQRPQGDYYVGTLSPTKKDCIQQFRGDDSDPWKQWYSRGFRCVKVKLAVA